MDVYFKSIKLQKAWGVTHIASKTTFPCFDETMAFLHPKLLVLLLFLGVIFLAPRMLRTPRQSLQERRRLNIVSRKNNPTAGNSLFESKRTNPNPGPPSPKFSDGAAETHHMLPRFSDDPLPSSPDGQVEVRGQLDDQPLDDPRPPPL